MFTLEYDNVCDALVTIIKILAVFYLSLRDFDLKAVLAPAFIELRIMCWSWNLLANDAVW